MVKKHYLCMKKRELRNGKENPQAKEATPA